jgi:hypothetical protein
LAGRMVRFSSSSVTSHLVLIFSDIGLIELLKSARGGLCFKVKFWRFDLNFDLKKLKNPRGERGFDDIKKGF